MQSKRRYGILDAFCIHFDQGLRALAGTVKTTGALYPARKVPEADLSDSLRKHAAGVMRVNHAGEICAQALYQGQGLVSQSESVRSKMQHAALEEGDHLYWCDKRLQELGSHTSYLNPVWYSGSFLIGMLAGLVGDKWSLGFLAETERQVIEHLQRQIQALPQEDVKSRAVLKQMEQDEAKHREDALSLGGKNLPWLINKMMQSTAKFMVKTAYWI